MTIDFSNIGIKAIYVGVNGINCPATNGLLDFVKGIDSLNLINFNIEGETSVELLFSYIELKNVKVSGVAKVKSLEGMFCGSIVNIDLSDFDTSHVKNMAEMFHGNSDITSIKLKSAKSVTNMHRMFYLCESLKHLDLGSDRLEHVSDISGAFYSCKKLEQLDLSCIDMCCAVNLEEAFKECRSLEELHLPNLNNNMITRLHGTFNGCNRLKKLDLYDFRIDRYASMDEIFCGCEALSEVRLPRDKASRQSVLMYLKAYDIKCKTV